MRAFPVAVRGLALVLVAAVFSAPPVQADDPSVADLQADLTTSLQSLDDLYAKSAAASERLNGAKYDETQATAALRHSRQAARRASRQLRAQRNAVATLTVEQLQQPTGITQWTALASSDGAQQMLERSSAYSSTQEGMTALLDSLAAQQVVFDSAVRQADEARSAGRAAEQRRRDAKSAIAAAVREAEKLVADATRRRDALIAAMAADQGITVEEAAQLHEVTDAEPDGGPERPGPTVPTTPSQPETPAPTTPVPTTPAPTTPTPAQPPPAPPASSSKVETAIAFARAQLGEKYEWGGAGPNKWDCSGLTMRAWQAAGVSLAHYAGAQYSSTRPVSVASIKRGDLLYWSDGGPGSIYHVSLYLGGGQMIHAPRPGRTVEIVPLTYWIAPDLASRPG